MKNLFAERFKAARELAGLTQDDIAEICKNRKGESLSRAAIAQWEDHEGTKPNFENLVAAAERLGTSIDYLAGLSDKPEIELHAGMPAESSDEYRQLSKAALVFARQWQNLPPVARTAIEDLIRALQKIINNKHTSRHGGIK
jgi:transcriptional regulator with XRE-family HTH domain